MAEKNTNILQNSLENSGFKDTGSAIDPIFQENLPDSTQNEEKSGGNTQNQLNSVENEAFLEENNQDIYCIFKYGVSVSAVAESLKSAVKYSVENFTGLIVDTVNVHVVGVRV